MTSKLVLLPTTSTNLSVRVHPVALFSICDAYIRRSKDQERVIGTLLGSIVDNVVEIKNCYVVPHTESMEQVAVDIAHHKTMFDLHQRVTAAEAILGWFATGSSMYNSDSLIQEFYAKEANNAIHLKVDTTLANGKFSIAAYQSRVLSLGGDKPLATEFVEVPCEVLFADVERAGVELLSSSAAGDTKAAAAGKPLVHNDVDSLVDSLSRLEGLLAQVHTHVQDVLAGRVAGDPSVGRYLADTLAVVPRLGKATLDRLFNDSAQDSLMVSYLANLLRTQIALAERLGTAQLPLL